MDGARAEDAGTGLQGAAGTARYGNHFHNPIKPWDEAGLDDFVYGVYPVGGRSLLLWAQNGSFQSSFPEGDHSWSKVKNDFYLVLTSKVEGERHKLFASAFYGLGFQLHLLQDAAVPPHVRNDAHGIESETGRSRFGSIFFETWAKKNQATINAFASQPVMPDLPLDSSTGGLSPITSFVDTNTYTGQNPSNGVNIGLAEYTNANFFSDDTIFSADDPLFSARHTFPYPKKSSTNLQAYQDAGILPERILADDFVEETIPYVAKTGDGELIDHFVRPMYYASAMMSWELNRDFYMDEACHTDYAGYLVPRAVGYSAALINYFFRGVISITPPKNGIYALYEPAQGNAAFTKITLRAQNVTARNEEMGNGFISLVVKYKLLPGDPINEPCGSNVKEPFSYIVVPESSGKRSIPRNQPAELVFELGSDGIPMDASDVYIQVVYKGKLGAEDDAVAVGFKDISEPTPVDIISILDKVCLYGKWLNAGSEGAIDLVDINGNKKADTDEVDVYAHDLQELYVRFSPIDDPQDAAADNYDVYRQKISPGSYERVFILSDYELNIATSLVWMIPVVSDDEWDYEIIDRYLDQVKAVKNQTELISFGLSDFYIKYCPTYKTVRERKVWISIIYMTNPYPPDSDECPLESLQAPE